MIKSRHGEFPENGELFGAAACGASRSSVLCQGKKSLGGRLGKASIEDRLWQSTQSKAWVATGYCENMAFSGFNGRIYQ